MLPPSIPDPPAAAHARLRRFLPWLAAAAYTAILAVLVAHHEMWRDEMQAWLFARDSPTPLALLQNMRYEGHPPLWHLLLWPLAQFSTNPAWMQVLHVAIAGTMSLVVFRFSPFSWPVRILLMCGYFFAFEWSVLARNYGLLALFAFVACALYARRWRYLPLTGLCLGLMSLSHALGMVIALAIGFTITVEFVFSYRRRTGAEKHTAGFVAGIVLAALCMAASILQALPPPDAAGGHPPNFTWKRAHARQLAVAVIDGYLPLPIDKRNFWNTNRFIGQSSFQGPQPLRIPPGYLLTTGVALLGFGALLLAGRPWMLVPFVLGTTGQLAFAHLFFFGHTRHHGFLFLMLVVALWMSFAHEPVEAATRAGGAPPPHGTLFRAWLRYRMKAFAALLLVHVAGAWIAIRTDWAEQFSQAHRAAQWLRQQFPDTGSVIFVGDRAPNASSVVGYLELERIYYPDRSDYGTYIVYDQRRLQPRTKSLQRELLALLQDEKKDAVLVLSRQLRDDPDTAAWAQLVQRFTPAIAGDESYWIYFVRHRG